MRVENYNYVHQTKLELQDSIGSIGTGEEVHYIFQIDEGPFRLYDFNDDHV